MYRSEYSFKIETIPQENLSATPARSFTRADLSEDQVEVYDSILSWDEDPNARQYLKVGGYAGTGKTTLVSAVAKYWQEQGKSVAYAAYTGKAVNVMSRKLRASGVYGSCSTLHSLMYEPHINEKGDVDGWEKKEALPCDFIVVDEASMIGKELWQDLLSYEIPILAVGDHGQLPPVGNDVVNLMQTPDLRLERIHRQAEGNPILELAQWVREGKSHLNYRSADPRVSFVPSFAAVAKRVALDPANFAAICYTNKTRVALNRFIRAEDSRFHDKVFPYVGDTVICLKNKKPVFNGMRGTVSIIGGMADSDGKINASIDFADDGLRLHTKFFLPQFNHPTTFSKLEEITLADGEHPKGWDKLGMFFDFGYALTCHKAQGSQFRDVVIVWENYFRDSDTRNRWMYTACTRAAERLWIVKP